MILELLLSVVAASGTYEYIYDVMPRMPIWVSLPLLFGLSAAVYFLPLMWVIILAVASAAGFIHGLVRKPSVPVVLNHRRSGLPPLP